MKTNELKCADLRIGNYVNYENRPFEVIEISPISLVVRKKIGDIFEMQHRALDVAQPIELTEEVLVKIGFKKVFQSAVTKGRFELNINIGDYEFVNMVYHIYKSGNPNFNITQRRCASLCDNSIYKNNVKYLHELQNAYYLLTNEELEVNL